LELGDIAESRLTILSDVDVLLCLEEGLGPEGLWALRGEGVGDGHR